MPSKTDIYNLACRHAKLGRVSAPDEDTPQAVALGDVYLTALNDLLAEAFWNFAKKTWILQKDADAPAHPRWGASFVLPPDCVQVYRINGIRNDTRSVKWEVERRWLLTDESSAVIEGTSRETNEGLFSAKFVDVLGLSLALAAFGADISDTRLQILEQKRARALAVAKAVDALEGSPRRFETGTLVRARMGAGGGDDPRFLS